MKIQNQHFEDLQGKLLDKIRHNNALLGLTPLLGSDSWMEESSQSWSIRNNLKLNLVMKINAIK